MDSTTTSTTGSHRDLVMTEEEEKNQPPTTDEQKEPQTLLHTWLPPGTPFVFDMSGIPLPTEVNATPFVFETKPTVTTDTAADQQQPAQPTLTTPPATADATPLNSTTGVTTPTAKDRSLVKKYKSNYRTSNGGSETTGGTVASTTSSEMSDANQTNSSMMKSSKLREPINPLEEVDWNEHMRTSEEVAAADKQLADEEAALKKLISSFEPVTITTPTTTEAKEKAVELKQEHNQDKPPVAITNIEAESKLVESVTSSSLTSETSSSKLSELIYGPFHHLSLSLISHICIFLPTSDLLLIRLLSHSWSKASRSSHAWSYSYWRHQPGSTNFKSMTRSMPYLRGLCIILTSTDVAKDYQTLIQLQALESIKINVLNLASFGDPSSNIFINLLYLPRLTRLVIDHDAQGRIFSDRVMGVLNSLKLSTLIHEGSAQGGFERLSQTKFVSTSLRVLDLLYSCTYQLTSNIMAKFVVLEELRLFVDIYLGPYNNDNLKAITHLPVLRILSFHSTEYKEMGFTPENLAALLTNPVFAQRLEYLKIVYAQFTKLEIFKIMNECTELLGLELTLVKPPATPSTVTITDNEPVRTVIHDNTFAPVLESDWFQYQLYNSVTRSKPLMMFQPDPAGVLSSHFTRFEPTHIQVDTNRANQPITYAQSMTCMPEYDGVSFEELRLNGEFVCHKPPAFTYAPVITNEGRYQSMTTEPSYEGASFEEIRIFGPEANYHHSRQVELPEVNLMFLLTAPKSFRERLLYLRLQTPGRSYNYQETFQQLFMKYPQLIHAKLGDSAELTSTRPTLPAITPPTPISLTATAGVFSPFALLPPKPANSWLLDAPSAVDKKVEAIHTWRFPLKTWRANGHEREYSPEFELDGMKWRILVLVNGDATKQTIPGCLAAYLELRHPDPKYSLFYHFQMQMVHPTNVHKSIWRDSKHTFTETEPDRGFSELLTPGAITEYTHPDGQVVIRVAVSDPAAEKAVPKIVKKCVEDPMQVVEEGKEVVPAATATNVVSESQFLSQYYCWRLPLLQWRAEGRDREYSPEFFMDGKKWRLLAFPHGAANHVIPDCLGIYLELRHPDNNYSVSYHFKMQMVHPTNKVLSVWRSSVHTFTHQEVDRGFNDLLLPATMADWTHSDGNVVFRVASYSYNPDAATGPPPVVTATPVKPLPTPRIKDVSFLSTIQQLANNRTKFHFVRALKLYAGLNDLTTYEKSFGRRFTLLGDYPIPMHVDDRPPAIEIEELPVTALHRPFITLAGDIISFLSNFLDTPALITMRRISKHWSHYARLSRAWVSSRWTPTHKGFQLGLGWVEYVQQLVKSMPHLRSIEFPRKFQPADSQLLLPLQQLRRLVLTETFDKDILEKFPHLRIFQLNRSDQDWTKDHLEVFGRLKLHTLIVTSEAEHDTDLAPGQKQFFEFISATPLVEQYLRILHLPIYLPNAISSSTIERFAVLEELYLEDMEEGFSTEFCRQLTAAPSLRILALKPADSSTIELNDAQVLALLDNSAFNQRLEYLALHNLHCSRTAILQVMTKLTNLIGLSLSFDSDLSDAFLPITELEWQLYHYRYPLRHQGLKTAAKTFRLMDQLWPSNWRPTRYVASNVQRVSVLLCPDPSCEHVEFPICTKHDVLLSREIPAVGGNPPTCGCPSILNAEPDLCDVDTGKSLEWQSCKGCRKLGAQLQFWSISAFEATQAMKLFSSNEGDVQNPLQVALKKISNLAHKATAPAPVDQTVAANQPVLVFTDASGKQIIQPVAVVQHPGQVGAQVNRPDSLSQDERASQSILGLTPVASTPPKSVEVARCITCHAAEFYHPKDRALDLRARAKFKLRAHAIHDCTGKIIFTHIKLVEAEATKLDYFLNQKARLSTLKEQTAADDDEDAMDCDESETREVHHLQSITCMREYQDATFEDLRLDGELVHQRLPPIDQDVRIFESDALDLMTFLTAPKEFRQRLAYLYIQVSNVATNLLPACHQLSDRYPSVVNIELPGVELNDSQMIPAVDAIPNENSFEWLHSVDRLIDDETTQGDVVAKATATSATGDVEEEEKKESLDGGVDDIKSNRLNRLSLSRGSSTVSTAAATPSTPSRPSRATHLMHPSNFPLAHQYPIMHWVRALKLHLQLPLTPFEMEFNEWPYEGNPHDGNEEDDEDEDENEEE